MTIMNSINLADTGGTLVQGIINGINEIDTDRLNNDSEKIYNLLLSLKKSEKKMLDEIAKLCRMWRGPAQSTFMNSLSNDINEIDQVFEFLQKYYQNMQTAKNTYDSTDENVRALVSFHKY